MLACLYVYIYVHICIYMYMHVYVYTADASLFSIPLSGTYLCVCRQVRGS